MNANELFAGAQLDEVEEQRDRAMMALRMLHSLLDFEEPLTTADPNWFVDVSGINEAYAFAYAVLNGHPTPELKAMKVWYESQPC